MRCTTCRLNLHNQLDILYVCGIYIKNKNLKTKTKNSVSTKGNALALAELDIGGKHTWEQGQIRA